MKRYDILTKTVYTKNGEEKAMWKNCGSLVFFPASGDKEAGYRLELNMFPETKFYVFENKPREDRAPRRQSQDEGEASQDVNPDDIPF